MNFSGSFDSLELCLPFKRSAGFCILQVFIPATAVVMSSWVALWMAEDTTFSDVLSVILAIIFLAYAYNSVMPRVSYVKLLDLYMCSCFLFVFLSLAKLVIIKYFCKKWAKENNQSSDWFLHQLAGMTMANQNKKDDDDVEKGEKENRRPSALSSSSDSIISDKKPVKNAQCNGPTLLLPPAVQRLRRSEKNRNVRIHMDSESGDDYESAAEKGSLESSLVKSKGSDEESINMNHFTEMTHSDLGQKDMDDEDDKMPARKMTFLGMEAFADYFAKQNQKKETELERKMRFLRWFHVTTQLALPIAFGAFFIFLLLVYPNVPQKRGC